MKYLCLIYEDERIMATMPGAAVDAVMQEYFAFTSQIEQSGHYVDGHELMPVAKATTVRVRNGELVTFDGPFAETKEQLGGYYLIEARDLDDAIQVASRIPAARTGSVEIRPIVVHS